VEETRPRNQERVRWTAWEFGQHGVPHHVDRATMPAATSCNTAPSTFASWVPIEPQRRATCATRSAPTSRRWPRRDLPGAVLCCLPSPSIDWTIRDGVAKIPSKNAGADEVRLVRGLGPTGSPARCWSTPQDSPVANPGFDVTPARLVTGLVTERGVRSQCQWISAVVPRAGRSQVSAREKRAVTAVSRTMKPRCWGYRRIVASAGYLNLRNRSKIMLEGGWASFSPFPRSLLLMEDGENR